MKMRNYKFSSLMVKIHVCQEAELSLSKQSKNVRFLAK